MGFSASIENGANGIRRRRSRGRKQTNSSGPLELATGSKTAPTPLLINHSIPADRSKSARRNQSEQLETKYHCDRRSIVEPTPASKRNGLLGRPQLTCSGLLLILGALFALSDLEAHQNRTNGQIIIDQQGFSGAQLLPASQHSAPASQAERPHLLGAHLQPSFVYGARNKSANFTHLLVDELTNSVYVGGTNLLLQLSAGNLRAEFALKTGPALEDSRDCAPADCLAQLAHLDPGQLPAHHAQGPDLSLLGPPSGAQSGRRSTQAGATMHTSARSPAVTGAARLISATHLAQTVQQQQQHYNNYNKILAIEPESRQLIVCGSLNQGACRRHQLGQLANFSELIPLPVAPNDEHSSAAALVVSGRTGAGYAGLAKPAGAQQRPVLYVAATNSRLGPYREMVPAISARYLEPANRAMQIIERSFTDSARVDISFELRDYYLVNYTYAFQHNEYVYFATVQRKSPLRQLEEWGYISRLARLCLNDLSFQSYAEITLECRGNKQTGSSHAFNANAGSSGEINYNLLQDAQVTSAGSTLAHQLGIKSHSSVLVGAFALSKDHTSRSQQKSAICLYPLEKIEQKFNENIHTCYNGSSKARNMNYIAGSVNDCPKAGVSINTLLSLILSPVGSVY